MAICPSNKIDSNSTGLRYAVERCLGVLPANPIWHALEPNSYSDFGSTITTVARNPINPSRQRRKGVVTDLEASGGFNQDVTFDNTNALYQGFLFAAARERGTTKSLVYGNLNVVSVDDADNAYTFNNQRVASASVVSGGSGYRVGDLLTVSGGTAQRAAVLYVSAVSGAGAVTAVAVDDGGVYSALPTSPATVTGGSGTGATVNPTAATIKNFSAGDIVLASGFSEAANNGLKTVVAFSGNTVEVTEAVTDETPSAEASLQTVGRVFDTSDLSIVMNGLLPRLTSAASVDFTTLGFIPGEWVYVEGLTNNVGFARIGAIAETYLEFDKVDWQPQAEDGTGKTVTLYFGTIIRNENDPALIKRYSYQLERTLGNDENGPMAEYLIGATPSELTLNVPQAEKVTVDLTFMGIDAEPRTGAQGLKAGARPVLPLSDAFNTSSDFSRIKIASVSETDPAPKPLFAFATDLSLTINNNVSANKAIGRLGAIDITVGTFEVSGSITAYFADMAAVQAVRNNADITMDFIIVKANTGLLFDIPLLALGNGRLAVEQDQPITLPLDTSAAESKFGHTLLIQIFPYLPNSAG